MASTDYMSMDLESMDNAMLIMKVRGAEPSSSGVKPTQKQGMIAHFHKGRTGVIGLAGSMNVRHPPCANSLLVPAS